jgi:hypothetical protein
MSDFLKHLAHSFVDQAGAWFVGVILALFGVFSGKLVETIKSALNRADLRTKYYEELAVDISRFVFIIDRIVKVSYGSNWAGEEDKSEIANEYNELMNRISGKEFIYLSWLQHYWGKNKVHEFTSMMEKIRQVDAALINLNTIMYVSKEDPKPGILQLEASYESLREAARNLLVTTI